MDQSRVYRYEFFDGKCAIKNCELPELAAGFCNKHWRRLKRYGSPLWLRMPAGAYRSLTMEQRFFRQVNKSKAGCWNWKNCKDQDGYGGFSGEFLGQLHRRAHRFSWAFHNNKVIPKGMAVLHSCDNPSCVNPGHLRLGTQAENQAEKLEKGRGCAPRGEDNGACRITQETASAIRSSTEFQYAIAAKYGVSCATVSDIKRRKSWRHIP